MLVCLPLSLLDTITCVSYKPLRLDNWNGEHLNPLSIWVIQQLCKTGKASISDSRTSPPRAHGGGQMVFISTTVTLIFLLCEFRCTSMTFQFINQQSGTQGSTKFTPITHVFPSVLNHLGFPESMGKRSENKRRTRSICYLWTYTKSLLQRLPQPIRCE